MKLFLLLYLLTSLSVFSAEVVIFGDDSERPRIYLDKEGSPAGFLIDILKFIEKNSDLGFKIELLPWSRSYKSAVLGRGGIIGVSRNEEREGIFHFSDEIFSEDVLLVGKKKEEASFKGIQTLEGKTVGITRGGFYGEKFDEMRKAKVFKVLELNDSVQRIAMLLRGRIDWAVIGSGKIGLVSALKENGSGSLEDLFIAPEPLVRDANFIGFKRTVENKEIIFKINKVLSSKEGARFMSSYLNR
ncbi:transporter substrate-binding domain-containing protein [Halobacteriovorax sp. JY17]|uniref:substrate-binding periplasmic protein n=1 Tax=Halobacteriovorax sp. JY17 TaxID=2014617 RepID=UPI000C494933|nr:transporter substrate-binding domain-containing protein [Halobacteriovorax sp. JY17]PIK14196.1 MAG: hypothetical protein CES88_14535 [Halobacteriovorax sp. JY17]